MSLAKLNTLSRGVACVELALVMGLMLVVGSALFEFGYYHLQSQRLTKLTSELANYALRGCATAISPYSCISSANFKSDLTLRFTEAFGPLGDKDTILLAAWVDPLSNAPTWQGTVLIGAGKDSQIPPNLIKALPLKVVFTIEIYRQHHGLLGTAKAFTPKEHYAAAII